MTCMTCTSITWLSTTCTNHITCMRMYCIKCICAHASNAHTSHAYVHAQHIQTCMHKHACITHHTHHIHTCMDARASHMCMHIYDIYALCMHMYHIYACNCITYIHAPGCYLRVACRLCAHAYVCAFI